MKKNRIGNILNGLEAGYDLMADKFSQTRSFFWDDLAFISDYVEDGDVVLDYGCGNGRFLEVIKNKKVDYFGVDISRNLIELAKIKYPEKKESFLKISSQDSLAFSDNFFNKIISIAVFHHFPVKYAKQQARELYRLTKPGGTIVVTVWNLWQKKHWKIFFDIFALINKITWIGEYSGFGLRDVFVPFRNNNNEVFRRYHHMYNKKELEGIFIKAGFKIESCFLVRNKNLVLIAKK
jgi:alkylated DNA repair protein alkB family protein 8